MVFTWLAGDVLGVFGNFYAALASYLKDFLPMSINFGAMKVAQDFLMDWDFFLLGILAFLGSLYRGFHCQNFKGAEAFVNLSLAFYWCLLWEHFSGLLFFGTQAFELIGNPEAYEGQFDSLYGSIFVFFDSLPQAGLIKLLGLILVLYFPDYIHRFCHLCAGDVCR